MTYNFLRFYGPPVAALYAGAGAAAATGGAALLTGEANGFAVDFTHAVDAERVAVKETLGPELLTNIGFDSGTDWGTDAIWVVSGGVATKEVSGGTANLGQTIAAGPLVAGRMYRTTFTVTAMTAGTVRLVLTGGATIFGVVRTVPGTYTETIVATAAHTGFKLQGDAAAVCTVDNVSFREVGYASGDTTVYSYGLDTFFTQIGTSPKQVYDSTGTLVWSPHNMCVQSENFAATWTVTGTPIVTANTVQDDDAAITEYIVQAFASLVVGATYTITGWFLKDAVTSRFPQLYVSSSGTIFGVTLNTSTGEKFDSLTTMAGTSTVTDEGTHWKLSLTVVMPAVTANIRIYPAYSVTLTGGGSNAAVGTITVAKVQLNRGSVPTAYLPTTTAARFGLAYSHDPTTLTPTGLFVEPAATNLQTQSNSIDTWTTKASCVVVADNAIAPNGLMQADRVTDDGLGGISGNVYLQIGAITVAATTVYNYSVYIKSNPDTVIDIRTSNDDAVRGAVFDLVAGTATPQAGGGTGTIQSLPNGWYRIATTWTSGADTSIGMRVGFPSITRDGTHSFWLWGAQMETGTIATSPIPTFAATATRAGDNVSFLLSAIPALGSEYSMYGRFSMPIAANSQYALCLSDGTAGNIATIRAADASRFTVYVGGSPQATIPAASIAADVVASAAERCKLNDFAGSQDGAAVGTDVSGTPPLVTKMAFGGISAAGAAFRVRHAVVVPRGWSNAELVTRSTP